MVAHMFSPPLREYVGQFLRIGSIYKQNLLSSRTLAQARVRDLLFLNTVPKLEFIPVHRVVNWFCRFAV